MPTRALLLLLAAGCLVACEPKRPPTIPAAPPGAYDTHEAKLAGGFISVRVDVPATPAGPKPAILTPLDDHRRALLEAGAIVVGYHVDWDSLAGFAPPPPPGAPQPKVGEWILAAPTPKTVGKGYFELIAYDANEAIPQVVDYLTTLPEVDATRIAIEGNSTSGFTALQAVAREPRLMAAVVSSACGDYHAFLHGSRLAMAGKPLDLAPDFDRWLRAQEPVEHPARLVHAALLLLNGAQDVAVPARCAQATDAVFRQAYERAGVPERYRFVLFNEATHNLGEDRMREAWAWWYRWLLTLHAAG